MATTTKTTKPAAAVPAFDEKTAQAIPHANLYRHEPTARTVGFHQPSESKTVHLFSLGRQFIATEKASDVPTIPVVAPAATPAPAPAASVAS